MLEMPKKNTDNKCFRKKLNLQRQLSFKSIFDEIRSSTTVELLKCSATVFLTTPKNWRTSWQNGKVRNLEQIPQTQKLI